MSEDVSWAKISSAASKMHRMEIRLNSGETVVSITDRLFVLLLYLTDF